VDTSISIYGRGLGKGKMMGRKPKAGPRCGCQCSDREMMKIPILRRETKEREDGGEGPEPGSDQRVSGRERDLRRGECRQKTKTGGEEIERGHRSMSEGGDEDKK